MKIKGIKASFGKRLVGILLLLMILGIAAIFGINGYVKQSAKQNIITKGALQETEEKADAVLVFGAQVKANRNLSLMLKERVDMGIQLYNAGIADRIIMSGDHGQEDYEEVNAMKSYAVEQGVPSECIFMDHAGFSTYDSMYRAKEVFQAEKVIVVTQEYHLYRAVYDADKLGLDKEIY